MYELLDSASTEITAQDILPSCRYRGDDLLGRSLTIAGLATVYRAIKALQLRGLLQARWPFGPVFDHR